MHSGIGRQGPGAVENPTIPILAGLSRVAQAHDLILCDVWGVLHDGVRAHADAGAALTAFRAMPGPRRRRVVLVSNAPRPWQGVQRILDRLGVPRAAYDAILTSGDLTRGLIADRPPGTSVHHLGPERDAGLFRDLPIALVPGEAADLVVCTGPFDDTRETAEDYGDRLAAFRSRGVPMICANPDLVVERDGLLITCAGAIAEAYAALGGQVVFAGKPHRPVYEAALAQGADLDGGGPDDPARVLAIGDALRTDIAGARAFGLPNLFVARGIHAEELGLLGNDRPLGDLAAWLSGQRVHPDAVVERLAW